MANVTDIESVPSPEPPFRTPKENIYELIQQIELDCLRQSLKNEFKRLFTDHDRLVSMLQHRTEVLETENGQLKHTTREYQRRYDKAVREMQFFRQICEGQNRPRKLSIESRSSDEVHGENTTGKAVVAGIKAYPLTPASSHASSPLRLDETTMTSCSSQKSSRSSSITNLSSEQSISWHDYPMPPPPQTPPPPVPSARTTTTATMATTTSFLIHQQRRCDPLMFGGSEALWETITKSNGSDVTVEKIISNFLRRGGSPNIAKLLASANDVKRGYGMIHAVVVTKALNSLDLLLEQGANPNAMTLSQVEDDKVTPCYLAASIGWLPGLQKLVQAGGNLIAARGAGIKNKTVLHVAAEHCHASVVEYIVAETHRQLDLEEDNMGATALHYACASGHTDLTSFLARTCKIPVNQPDSRGELPLHWAAKNGRLEVVTLLIERFGCDMNAYVSRKVGTPLDLAKINGHRRLIDYLKSLGALTAKKLEKRREEELEHGVPDLLQNTLERNGFFSMGAEEEEQLI